MKNLESGGDIKVSPCDKCGYKLVNVGLSIIQGMAIKGGSEMWYHKGYGGKNTVGHEVAHLLGFDHIGRDQLMSVGSRVGRSLSPVTLNVKKLIEMY